MRGKEASAIVTDTPDRSPDDRRVKSQLVV
jgi:hypothetical protein